MCETRLIKRKSRDLLRIAKMFGVDVETALRWYGEGAPIIYVDGYFLANKNEVWKWLKGRDKSTMDERQKTVRVCTEVGLDISR